MHRFRKSTQSRLLTAVSALFLLVGAIQGSAQTLEVTSEVAVGLAAPTEWPSIDIGVMSPVLLPGEVLLPGGDWLMKIWIPGDRNSSPYIDRVGFERRSPTGTLKWNIDRAFTNRAQMGSPIGPASMVVTRTGLFHVLVGAYGYSLWTGTTDGVILREDTAFDGLYNSMYADNEKLAFLNGESGGSSIHCLRTSSLNLSGWSLSVCESDALRSGGRILHVDDSGYWLYNEDSFVKIGADGKFIRRWGFYSGPGLSESYYPLVFRRHGEGFLVGGSIGGPIGNDLSQAFGQRDAWIVWSTLLGGKIRDHSYGGVGWDSLSGLAQTADGGFLLAIDSKGSGISGNKTVDGDGLWLVKISSTGTIQGQRLIPNQSFFAMGSTDTGISLLMKDTATGKRLQSVQISTEVVAKVRASSPSPFNLETSNDLQTWRVLGSRVLGEVEFSQPTREAAQFYRMAPAR